MSDNDKVCTQGVHHEEGEMGDAKLWETDHPYYANEGCYHAAGYHTKHASWAAFAETMGDSDPDLNLVYRWDWKREADDDGERSADARPGNELLVFFVAQRKGYCFSAGVKVTPEDEPAVRTWLAERAKTITAIWAPITVSLGSNT